MKTNLTALAVAVAMTAAGLCFSPSPASATVVYTMNVDYCTDACLNGATGGTVTLSNSTDINTLASNQVQVDVSLTPEFFHSTNGFTSFVFNLSGISTIAVTSISDNGSGDFVLVSTAAGHPGQGQNNTLIHEDGAGDFLYGLDQENGANFSGASTLRFIVTASGLTTGSFNLLSSGGNPSAYFAASVYNASNPSCTGVIGSNGGTTPVRTPSHSDTCSTPSIGPEPGTLALFGTALVGLGLIRRRRHQRKEAA